jgi:hypothetical protein
VSPVRYELGFYIPEDGIPHSRRREIRKSLNTCEEYCIVPIVRHMGGRDTDAPKASICIQDLPGGGGGGGGRGGTSYQNTTT